MAAFFNCCLVEKNNLFTETLNLDDLLVYVLKISSVHKNII